MSDDQKQIIISIDGSVGRLLLNRPDAHNALSHSMWNELPKAIDSLQDQGASVVIITGVGSSFAAGADLVELAKISNYQDAHSQWFVIADALNAIWSTPVVTIAMVNGPCLGGGCLLALACDLRYASTRASFGIPVAKLGIVLDEVNIKRLASVVGLGFAREMLYTGLTYSAAQAAQMQLVNKVLETEPQLLEYAQLRAKEIAANASVSVKLAKQAINHWASPIGAETLLAEHDVVGSYLSEEFRRRIKQYHKA